MFSSFTHYRWNVAILGKVDIQIWFESLFSVYQHLFQKTDVVRMFKTTFFFLLGIW